MYSLIISGAYSIVLVIRNHDKEIERLTIGMSLGQQHMIGPATVAEAEALRARHVGSVNSPEGPFVRYGYA